MRILELLSRYVAPRGPADSAAAQLRGMSERELADLGIGRSEIPAVLSEPRAPTRPVLRPLPRRLPA